MTKFEKIEQKVKQIISREFPLWYVERTITYKKSHTVWACGDTQLWRNIPIAVVRLSSRYDQTDGNTLVHELVHAFLPYKERHGYKFQTVCQYIKAHTEYDPLISQDACEPKYRIKYYRRGQKTIVNEKSLYRATKEVKYIKSNDGKVNFVWKEEEYTAVLEVLR